MTYLSSSIFSQLETLPWKIFNPSNSKATFVQSTRMQRFCKPAKPCSIAIHYIDLTEYSQMRTRVPGFQSFFSILRHFVHTYWQNKTPAAMEGLMHC